MKRLFFIFSVCVFIIGSGCGFESDNDSPKKESGANTDNVPKEEVQLPTQNLNDNNTSFAWESIAIDFLFVLNILLFVGFVYVIKQYLSLKKRVGSIVENNDEIKKRLKKQALQYEQQAVIQHFTFDDKRIDSIVDVILPKVIDCVMLELKDNKRQIEKQPAAVNAEEIYLNVKYFRSKQGRILHEEVNNENEGIFKVFNINDTEGKFEYYGGVVNSDFFADICEFENNPQEVPDKTLIRTTVPGGVKRDINGNWEIVSPAKIKFE